MMREQLLPRFPDIPAETVLELNTPFDWQPNTTPKTGVIMTHGLFGSPFFMRDFGRYFVERGIHARSLLLPGHCTDPRDLTRINLEAYQTTVKTHIDAMKDTVDELYLLGFSFGGLLNLDYLLRHPDKKIKGLVMLCPALGLASRWAFLLPALDKSKLLRCYHSEKETDYARYQSMAVRAAHQVYKLIKTLPPIRDMMLPKLMLVASADDEVVSSPTILHFFNETQTTDKRLIWYGQHNNSEQKNVSYRNSYFPDDNVVNASHISLLFSPNNSYYGKDGSARHALYHSCSFKAKHAVYGAINKKTLQQYDVYRASFNPDFEFLAQQLSDFINEKNT